MSQKPAMRSLVTANGPLVTVGSLPAYLIRAPFDVGCSPSPASMTPAFTISSLNLPIAVSISVLGITPASLFLSAFTITMNRIVRLRLVSIHWAGCKPALVNRTKGLLRHRHVLRNYFESSCVPGGASDIAAASSRRRLPREHREIRLGFLQHARVRGPRLETVEICRDILVGLAK